MIYMALGVWFVFVFVAASSERSVVVTDSVHQLDGHSSRVTSLSWSLHHDGLLATASYDWLSLVLCISIIIFTFALLAHFSKLLHSVPLHGQLP